uniref:Uncharacterized protein n=1 Tax=Daphnia magna TaxID=35525 RepID=A0A0P5YSF0_9CRUS
MCGKSTNLIPSTGTPQNNPAFEKPPDTSTTFLKSLLSTLSDPLYFRLPGFSVDHASGKSLTSFYLNHNPYHVIIHF